jgi:2-(1,2-epoxy-1,2-dihydrophenyl)acetyl-CoA isomerase
MRRFMNHLIERLSGFPLPIIAAVNGAAVEAGMSLALACDIIVASENAYFTPSFAHLGLVPDPGITFHLPRSIGTARSLSSMLLSEKIDAQTAPEWASFMLLSHATRYSHVRCRLPSGSWRARA